MIRTVVTPQNTELHLSIPKDYVGKQVEVLVYTTDEVATETTSAKSVSSLRGKLHLSTEQHKDFHQYLSDVRKEWTKDI